MTAAAWLAPALAAAAAGAGAARAWRSRLLEDLEYRREVRPTRLFPGDRAVLEITVENRKRLAVPWLVTEDEVAEGVSVLAARSWRAARGRRVWVQAWHVPGRHRVRRAFQLVARERGWQPFGPVSLRAGDPFGLVAARREPVDAEGGRRDGVVVLPRPLPLAAAEALSEYGRRGGAGWLHRDPANVVGLRPYTPGDPFRSIDWKATARAGGLRVRETAPWHAPSLVLVVDIATTRPVWLGRVRARQEAALGVAAWFVLRAAGVGALRLHVNGGLLGEMADVDLSLPPGGAPLALEALGRVAGAVRRPLAETLRRMPPCPAEARVVVVTALPDGEVWEAAHAAARRPFIVGVGAEAEGNPYVHARVGEEEVEAWWRACLAAAG
ncbi:MAG: DUF58 domain-containing protein [Firmicutes bacterium]|nr:DUF58 domain-containing protein [Bacillota bacterium]MBE3590898.1 DUF58 domain-containing protein [Bacillota bacterium]